MMVMSWTSAGAGATFSDRDVVGATSRGSISSSPGDPSQARPSEPGEPPGLATCGRSVGREPQAGGPAEPMLWSLSAVLSILPGHGDLRVPLSGLRAPVRAAALDDGRGGR